MLKGGDNVHLHTHLKQTVGFRIKMVGESTHKMHPIEMENGTKRRQIVEN